MAVQPGTNRHEDDFPELDGVTLANVDLTDRVLFAKLRERDLQAAEARIKAAVQHLQDLGVIDSQGRRLPARRLTTPE